MPVALLTASLTAHTAEEVPFGIKRWPHVHGSHRAIVKVKTKSDSVFAHIPWPRRNLEPKEKAIIVYDLSTNKRIQNVGPTQKGQYRNLVFWRAGDTRPPRSRRQ